LTLIGFNFSFAVTKPTPSVSKSTVQYFTFSDGQQIPFADLDKWLHATFKVGDGFNLSVINTITDALGITTYRYQETWNNIPVQGSMWLVHVKNDKIISCNGTIQSSFTCPLNATITGDAARDLAISFINANTYMWQSAASEQMIKNQTNNPQA